MRLSCDLGFLGHSGTRSVDFDSESKKKVQQRRACGTWQDLFTKDERSQQVWIPAVSQATRPISCDVCMNWRHFANETVLNHDKMQSERTRSPKESTIFRYQSICSSEMVKLAQCIKPPTANLPNVTRTSCNRRLSASALTKAPCGKCREGFSAQWGLNWLAKRII